MDVSELTKSYAPSGQTLYFLRLGTLGFGVPQESQASSSWRVCTVRFKPR